MTKEIRLKSKESRFERIIRKSKRAYINNKDYIYFFFIFMLFGIFYSIFATNQQLFLYSSVIVTGIFYVLADQLTDMIIVFGANLKAETIHANEMRRSVYNKYKKLDWDGKETADKYRFTTEKGEGVAVDKINRLEKVLRINKASSNIEFIQRYKRRLQELSRICCNQLNRIMELRQELEYRSVLEGAKQYAKSPIITEIFDDFGKDESKDEEPIEIEEEELIKYLEEEKEEERKEKSEVKA